MSIFHPEPEGGLSYSRPPTPSQGWNFDSHPPVTPGPSPVGSSKQTPPLRLDSLFNFQLVVFEVEGTLFQVLKNGFNVPGTIFEAMFALPVPTSELGDVDLNKSVAEGSSLENPIQLAQVRATDFRAFLRILYPFIGPSISLTYEDWVGILKLSTMWNFYEIREQAISKLSTLLPEKTPAQRISLGRTYRVSPWVRDEYIRLAQKTNLQLDELRGSSDIFLDWETISKIFAVREQNHLRNLKSSRVSGGYRCATCNVSFGWNTEIMDCRCHLPSVVDSIFQAEFQEMNPPSKEDSLPPLPASSASGKKKKKKGGSTTSGDSRNPPSIFSRGPVDGWGQLGSTPEELGSDSRNPPSIFSWGPGDGLGQLGSAPEELGSHIDSF